MKKLFIHIGPHKTGSTYIQKALFDQSKSLTEVGVLYPSELIGPQWGHHRLVEKIKQRNKNVVQSFLNCEFEKILISSENFEDLSDADIKFLSSCIEGFSVEVIFFKRAYSKLLVSAWQESIKQGEYKLWSEFLLEHTLKPFKSQILNSIGVIERWNDLADKIHIFDYEAMISNDLDIAQSMCKKVVGINLQVTKASVNKSMHLADIELIRMLNYRHFVKTGIHPRTSVRDAYLGLKQSKNAYLADIYEKVKSLLVEKSLDDSWTIDFFEKKFTSKHELYFHQNTVLKNTYYLPDTNVLLSDDFVNNLVAVEKLLKP